MACGFGMMGLVLSRELSDSRLFRGRLVDRPVGGDSAKNQAAEWENPTSFREDQRKTRSAEFFDHTGSIFVKER